MLAGALPGGEGRGVDPGPVRLFDGAGGVRDMPADPGDRRGFHRAMVAALRGGGAPPVAAGAALG